MPKPALKWFAKKTKKGFRGYPVGTVAFYGPDDRKATKVAVSIVLGDDQEPADLRRWFSDQLDIRADLQMLEEAQAFIQAAGVKSIAMVDGIFGCPHEEGIDYEGPTCPRCPYWAGRDRFTGETIS